MTNIISSKNIRIGINTEDSLFDCVKLSRSNTEKLIREVNKAEKNRIKKLSRRRRISFKFSKNQTYISIPSKEAI